jgi:Cu/Ag efflux protein CusF
MRRNRWTTSLGAALGVLLLLSVTHAQPKGKAFAFRGKVEKIDTKTKTLTVNGENVQGWMAAMTMTYTPDKEDVISQVKVGDEITAKVYEGNFNTLYEVQVVPPKSKAPPAKK